MRRAALLLVAVLVLEGCGTIMNGSKQTMRIRSTAPDAEVSIKSFKGQEVYQGPPAAVELARDESYSVVARAPGHKERKTTIVRSMSGWMFGNIVWILPIFWGVGIAVDAWSGGLWTLGDNDIDVNLVREPAAPSTVSLPHATKPPPPNDKLLDSNENPSPP